MFKEFIDNHANKATRQANQFAEERNVEVKSFVAFADNLAKTHLVIEFTEAKEDAPTTKKVTPRSQLLLLSKRRSNEQRQVISLQRW